MRARPCAHIATLDELPYLKESGVRISALYLSMLLFMLCLNLNSLNLDTARFVFSRALPGEEYQAFSEFRFRPLMSGTTLAKCAD